MARRAKLWLTLALTVASGLALGLPDSPLYLPDLVGASVRYQGRTTRSWLPDLNHPDPYVRHKAIFALGEIGPAAGEATPALANLLSADHPGDDRRLAAQALAKMAPASRQALPALAAALEDEAPAVRLEAALALSRLGEEARPALPQLIAALQDGRNQVQPAPHQPGVQEAVATALGQAGAGSAEAADALLDALDEAATEGQRVALVRALGAVGSAARPALGVLRSLTRDGSLPVRRAATVALRAIGASSPAASSESPQETLQLPETERKYLWDLEHHGNLLVKHAFAPLAEALRKADASALRRMLADDFRGADLGKPRRIRTATGYAEVERLEDSGRPPEPLDRDGFFAWLMRQRRLFAVRPPEVKLALMTLAPKRRGRLDDPWQGTTQLRLYGEHAPGAPAEVVVLMHFEVARPERDRLSRPGWLRSVRIQQTQTAKAPAYLFAEVGRQRGLDGSKLHDNWTCPRALFNPHPGGVYVCDFDRDGVLDILITDTTGFTLYKGRSGGGFEDVTDAYGLPHGPALNHSAAWIDIDGDGWDDLILAGRVYRNEQGKRFVDYSSRCNLHLPVNAMGLIVADYDRDGKLDLYVTRSARPGNRSWLEGESAVRRGNYLFRNKGNWQFEDVTRKSGAGGGRRSTFAAAWLDANNDGWPDLHVINEFGDGVLLINNHNGTFSPRRLSDKPADFGTMGVAVGDVNNDGNIDIYCANMYSKAGARVIGNLAPDAYPPKVMEKLRRFVAGSQLHLNQGGLKFEQVGARMQVAAVGWAYGPCLADLDNDGWLDIYATAGFVSRDRTEPDG